MSIEDNKALLYRIFNLLNTGKLDAYYELFDPDYIARSPNGNYSQEEIKQMDAGLLAAFPDYHFTVEDVVAEGDKVAFRATFLGTHTGEWMGVAPTGRKMSFTMFFISRISNGKVVEDQLLSDLPLMMQQLGVVPKQ
jgi:predicted ester cyclase